MTHPRSPVHPSFLGHDTSTDDLTRPKNGGLAFVALAALGLAVAGLTVAGCSDDGGGDVDAQVDQHVAQQLSLDEGQVGTDCPHGAQLDEGQAFTCQITVDGQHLSASVTVGAGGKVDSKLSGVAVSKDQLEAQLKADVQQQIGIEVATLDCGGQQQVLVPYEGTIDCQGRSTAGDPGTVVVGLDEHGKPVIKDLRNAPSPTTTVAAPPA